MFCRKIIPIFLLFFSSFSFAESMDLFGYEGRVNNDTFGMQDLTVIESMAKSISKLKKDSIVVGGQKISKRDAFSFLEEAGFGAKEKDEIYFLISWEMPDKLIKEILEDAFSVGGVVVTKGIPKHVNTMSGYVSFLKEFIGNGEKTPEIQINPLVFQAFDVKLVPSTVYIKDKEKICENEIRVKETYKEKQFSVSNCEHLDEKDFIKVGGGVTLRFALESFEENGYNVKKYLKMQTEYAKDGGIEAVAKKKKLLKDNYGSFDEEGYLNPYEFDYKFFEDQ